MRRPRSFFLLTTSDFIVRSGYQMGKTPLLPLFAASLGATDLTLGLIVSVSTVTGMVLKPFIGVLSDRTGRRVWLLAGTAFFALVPFLYWFIHTPQQLFAVRITHGLATAIYGPVTLAFLADRSRGRLAEDIGWFSLARSGGYILGPLVGAWLLQFLPPAMIFSIIGLISCLVFLPALFLPESRPVQARKNRSWLRDSLHTLRASGKSPTVWLAGGLEGSMYIALYAIKTFLPIYGLAEGMSLLAVGTFLAVQEGTNMLLKPLGGRLGDRIGYTRSLVFGLIVLGTSLVLMTRVTSDLALMLPAITFGVAQALISPSATALAGTRLHHDNRGSVMGLIGAQKNAGKIAGPILTGFLIQYLTYANTLLLIAGVLLSLALILSLSGLGWPQPFRLAGQRLEISGD